MKRTCKLLVGTLVMFFTSMTFMVSAQSYDRLWKQLQEAENKNLPQSVQQIAGQILEKALKEKQAGQMFKAYLYRENYQERVTPESLYARFPKIEQLVKIEENKGNRAILHSLLANMYADYLQRNAYVLSRRTNVEEDVSDDIREWSVNAFVQKVDEHAQASLEDKELLLSLSSAQYIPFIVQEKGSKFFGHDLWHLLVRRALEAYKSLSVNESSNLSRSRCEELYQTLIEMYAGKNPNAEVLVSLDYWRWRRDFSGVDKVAELDELIGRFGNSEATAEVYLEKAEYLYSKSSYEEADKVCDEAVSRYPRYYRINALKNIKRQLYMPALDVNFPKFVHPADEMKLRVNYSNVKGITAYIYATDLKAIPENYNEKDLSYKHLALLQTCHFKPAEAELLNKEPFIDKDSVFTLPALEKNGVYLLRIEADGENAMAKMDYVAVTRLNLITLDLGGGKYEFTTIDNKSGHPEAGVQVVLQANTKPMATFTTDELGQYVYQIPENAQINRYSLSKDDDTVYINQYVGLRNYKSDERELEKVDAVLLTDRSIYRPGQTIYIKGILYSHKGGGAQVMRNVEDELVLRDVNSQEVARQKVVTGDFGSFTAEFVLPAVCLNGNFTIRLEREGGSSSFRVEEYKRPNFEITFNPAEKAYRMGDDIFLTGNAKMLNGVSLQDVVLRYTVTRIDINRFWRNSMNDKPLLADSVRIDAEGNFSIPVHLQKDENSSLNKNFVFEVKAVVTDITGETQEAATYIEASPRAYQILFDIPSVVKKDDKMTYKIGVTNYSNKMQDVQVHYQLYLMSKEGGESDAQKKMESIVTANQPIDFSVWRSLPSGNYKMEINIPEEEILAEDERTSETFFFTLYAADDRQLGTYMEVFCPDSRLEFAPEVPAKVMFGTSQKDVYVFMDIFRHNTRLDSKVLQLNDEIVSLDIPYKESYGDGITLLFFFVKEGKSYSRIVTIEKKRTDTTLQLKWEVFRDKLQPGSTEEWRLVVHDAQGQPAMAELLALMYDASLDAIYQNRQTFRVNHSGYYKYVNKSYAGYSRKSLYLEKNVPRLNVVSLEYDHFFELYRRMFMKSALTTRTQTVRGIAYASAGMDAYSMEENMAVLDAGISIEEEAVAAEEEGGFLDSPDEGLRTNFAETAFFYPQLRTNEYGEVVVAFTTPESLTRWNVLGYAHTTDMKTGSIEASAITAKEFMIRPDMPRFLRTGDEVQIVSAIQNLNGNDVTGKVTLVLFNPANEKIYANQKQNFTLKDGETGSVRFKFSVPEGLDLIGIRIVADGKGFSDGEQHLLPVFSNKQHILESVSMPVRGNQTRTFDLESLFNHHHKDATQRRLTIEFTGNPVWYAVQALPSVSTPLRDNAIDWAVSYYVNSLAGHIVDTHPRIQQVFSVWKNKLSGEESLISQLEKNAELKEILLSETPWVLDAKNETEQRQRIATLFDLNQMRNKLASSLVKLQMLQNEDGGWSWYKGMGSSWNTTSFIVEQLVRAQLFTGRRLDGQENIMLHKAWNFLHQKALDAYDEIQRSIKRGEKYEHLSDAMMDYVYLITLSEEQLPAQNEKAYKFFMSCIQNGLPESSLVRSAKSAVVLKKAGQVTKAAEFIASLKEHLVQEDDLGAHFAFLDESYNWTMLAIPTHVAVMEAFQEFEGNESLIEEMKIWLLKQKQVQGWSNSVATANAVRALISTGTDLLQNLGEVRIAVADKVMTTSKTEETLIPGLSYIRQSYEGNSSVLAAREIKVEKNDAGVAWGAVYAQYLSPVTEVAQQGSGAMNVDRKFYVEHISADGRKSLIEIGKDEALLKVGDVLVSRMTVRTDRSMDFVELTDRMASCFEPLNLLSGYRWNQGAGYYMDNKDTATNFFFDSLSKGVYVMETRYRVTRAGKYQVGLATMQCAYAPEFSSHSSGLTIMVNE